MRLSRARDGTMTPHPFYPPARPHVHQNRKRPDRAGRCADRSAHGQPLTSPSGMQLLAQSAIAVSVTVSTSETVLATITVSGDSMAPEGAFRTVQKEASPYGVGQFPDTYVRISTDAAGRHKTRKGRNPCYCLGFRPSWDVRGHRVGGGGGSRTRVRRRLTPGTTCLAHRWISSRDSTMCEAHRRTSPFDLTHVDRRRRWAIP